MTVIILLILIGIILILLELFIIPGITFAGIAGFIFTTAGIYMAYATLGKSGGHLTLGVSLLFFVLVLVIVLRTGTWNKLMLTTEVSSTIEPIAKDVINEGDTGKTVTRLNPVGKVKVNSTTIEARCPGQYVEPGTEVEVVKVFKNYIVVKLKS